MPKIDIKKELLSNQSLLLIVSNVDYNDLVVKTAKALANNKKICYVALNKTYDSLKELFEKNEIPIKNVVFIDAISKTLKKTPDRLPNAYFVSSPSALTELSLTITKLMNSEKFDYFIFDSITNLLIYQRKEPVVKFVSSIINRVKQKEIKSVFYAINVKEQEEVIKEVSMFVDNVIQTKNDKK